MVTLVVFEKLWVVSIKANVGVLEQVTGRTTNA